MVRSLGLLYTSPQQDCVTVVTLNFFPKHNHSGVLDLLDSFLYNEIAAYYKIGLHLTPGSKSWTPTKWTSSRFQRRPGPQP